jgi:DNA-binding transcriptional regulator PaaX
MPTNKLKQMARKSWEFVRENHTKEKFAENYSKTIEKILKNDSQKNEVLIHV